MSAPDTAPWPITRTTVATLTAGTVLLAVGLLRGSADVALLGLPLVLSTLWAQAHRPLTPATAQIRPAATTDGHLTATLELTTPPGSAIVSTQITAPHREPAHTIVHVPRTRTLTLTTPTARTGPHPPYTATTTATSALGTRTDDAHTVTGTTTHILPTPRELRTTPIPTTLHGLIGPHTSRRGGDGSELRDIAPFTPGDRLRRIDWRATARRSPHFNTLYVRRTLATAEATVQLVIDSRDDLGPDTTDWGMPHPARNHPGSLDNAREAAASIAHHVLTRGDRIGLEELSPYRRSIPPGSGQRHLRRILHALAHTTAHGETEHHRRPPQLPTGALVYLFSTFLDHTALDHALHWRSTGHHVIAVDTLPPINTHLTPRHLTSAWRIIQLERDHRLHTLATHGITVTTWPTTDPTTPPPARAQLQAASRRRHR